MPEWHAKAYTDKATLPNGSIDNSQAVPTAAAAKPETTTCLSLKCQKQKQWH